MKEATRSLVKGRHWRVNEDLCSAESALDFSKYVMHMWHVSWYLTNFYSVSSDSSESSPWQAAGKACVDYFLLMRNSQTGIQEVSSCLTLPGTDPPSDRWCHWVAHGLQHVDACKGCYCRQQWWSQAVAAANSWTLRSLQGRRERGCNVKGEPLASAW